MDMLEKEEEENLIQILTLDHSYTRYINWDTKTPKPNYDEPMSSAAAARLDETMDQLYSVGSGSLDDQSLFDMSLNKTLPQVDSISVEGKYTNIWLLDNFAFSKRFASYGNLHLK